MAFATITSKGQVAIPKIVRNSLNLKVGDKLQFIVNEKGGLFVRPVSKRVDEVYGNLHRNGMRPVSVEEMDEAVRRRMKECQETVA